MKMKETKEKPSIFPIFYDCMLTSPNLSFDDSLDNKTEAKLTFSFTLDVPTCFVCYTANIHRLLSLGQLDNNWSLNRFLLGAVLVLL